MSEVIFRREELVGAKLQLGAATIELASYETTGLRMVTIGPSGIGKSNSGYLVAEQLSKQGWISVIVDPEREAAALFGDPVESPQALRSVLERRSKPIVVVRAADAIAFVPYGEVIMEVADRTRKPIFLMMDEGQMFSASRKRADGFGDSSDLINDFCGRGRKRALDFFVTAPTLSGSLNRGAFAHKNLTLIGCLQDPVAWSSLAPQFRGTQIGYQDLMSLDPGEFFCFSRRGVEKVAIQLSAALAKVAPKARTTQPRLPRNFTEWDRLLRRIPTERLQQLSPELVDFMSTIAGLTPAQLSSGVRALQDELEDRA